MAETAAQHKWTIIAADGEGDTVEIQESPKAHLAQLLRKGVHDLVGEHAKPGDYDILIGGTVQEHLNRPLEDVGLHDRSEVTIIAKDVSRG
jgi:hypothetical protein